jgi:DNA polymerase III subunit delta'
MLFKEIPGQEEVKQQLIRSVKDSRISHAQLFLGPEGSGSMALAIAYAQYISCTNRNENDSCGECSSCRKYNKLIHPDLHFSYPFIANKEKKVEVSTDVIPAWREAIIENPFQGLEEWMQMLDAENKQPNINIAECHDIIKRLTYKSFESEYKILIMWLPEYLGTEGNSLLKLIEEPPEKTLFILVAQNHDQILNTILSRTQLIKIKKLGDQEVCAYLTGVLGCNEAKAKRIAYLSNGNLAAALNLFREEDNDLELLFVQWVRLCYGRKGVEVLEWMEGIIKSGRENQKNLLKLGLQIIRDSIVLKEGLNEIVRFESEQFEIEKFATVLNYANAPQIIRSLEEAIYHIERNANPRILFLDLSVQMMRNLQIKTVNSQLTLT